MRPMIQDLCLLNFLVPKLLSPISSKQKPRLVQLFCITNQLFKPTVLCNNQLLELSSTKPIQSVGLNSRIFFWKVKTSNIEERRVFWGKVSSVEHDHAWQRLNKIVSAINPNLETSTQRTLINFKTELQTAWWWLVNSKIKIWNSVHPYTYYSWVYLNLSNVWVIS